MFTIVVTGSRGWTDAQRITDMVKYYSKEHGKNVMLVHGDAPGADRLCAAAAEAAGWTVKSTPANWSRDGRGAGFVRNIAMLEDNKPDVVVAFWDGESRGTKHTIEQARKRKITTWVVKPPTFVGV